MEMKNVAIQLTVYATIPKHYTIEDIDDAISVAVTNRHVNEIEVEDVVDLDEDD